MSEERSVENELLSKRMDQIGELETYVQSLEDQLAESKRDLEGLLSENTAEWKSAAFQKIKKLESKLAESERKRGELEKELSDLKREFLTTFVDPVDALVVKYFNGFSNGYFSDKSKFTCDAFAKELKTDLTVLFGSVQSKLTSQAEIIEKLGELAQKAINFHSVKNWPAFEKLADTLALLQKEGGKEGG